MTELVFILRFLRRIDKKGELIFSKFGRSAINENYIATAATVASFIMYQDVDNILITY